MHREDEEEEVEKKKKKQIEREEMGKNSILKMKFGTLVVGW